MLQAGCAVRVSCPVSQRGSPCRGSQRCRAATTSMTPAVSEFSAAADALTPSPKGTWDNYVKGVVAQYARAFRCVLPTCPPPLAPPSISAHRVCSRSGESFACDVAIVSDVPLGAGLSSSAALEVGVGTPDVRRLTPSCTC
jgi:galactokinase